MERGITLVETMLSLTLLAIGLILLLNLFPTAMRSVTQAEERMQANTLARNLLEEQQARAFPALVVGGPYAQDPVGMFERDLTIFEVYDQDPHLVLGVRATVRWEHGGRHLQVLQEQSVANVRK